MHAVSRGLVVAVAGTLLSGCALVGGPLLRPSPVDPTPLEPVVAQYAGSVGRVLSTTCYGTPISGSGFVVDANHLLTAAHVVDGARQVSLRLTGSGPILADVVGIDPGRDTALLRTTVELTARPIALAEAGTTVAGTAVATLGLPLGDAGLHTELTRITATTDTAGVNDRSMGDLVTLDVTLRPGSSGGPAVDADGLVRGMVVASSGGRGGRDSVATVTLAVPTASLADSLAAWRDAVPVRTTVCEGETAPAAAAGLELTGDAGDAELAHTLWLLGTSINRDQWGSAWQMLTDDLRLREGNQDAWTTRNSGVRWTQLALSRATRTDEEHATARVRLRTSTQAGCGEQVIDFGLRFVQQAWLVDSVVPGSRSSCG